MSMHSEAVTVTGGMTVQCTPAVQLPEHAHQALIHLLATEIVHP